jgi:nucleoside-diphosphate-sugar epimerase
VSTASVLVTGATGYLGRHLLRVLRQQGVRAAVLVRQAASWHAQSWSHEAGPVGVIEGEPLHPEAWRHRPELAHVRTIFHVAGIVHHSRKAPEAMIEFNVRGTLQMVRVAKALGARLVFVSSSGTVGCFRFQDMTADEDSPYAEALVRRWPYYASKIKAERDARRLSDQLGVELVTVRPPVLLGPDDHRRRSTGYVQKVIDGRIPAVPRGGMHFTDVRDVAGALARLHEQQSPRQIYHLPGTASTLSEFFHMVCDVSGMRFERRPMPVWATHGIAGLARVSGWKPRWIPDPVVLEMSTCFWGITSLFAHELGYAPRSARQTLSDTVAWLRASPAERADGDSHSVQRAPRRKAAATASSNAQP